MSIHVKKAWVLLILGFASLILFVALLPVIWLALIRCTYGDWNKTLASLGEDGAIEAVVHGSTDSPVTGWDAELVWRKDPDKWFVYYLSHEAYFEKYQLKKSGADIEVFCNGRLIGKLDTKTSKFSHFKQNLVYDSPLDVIHEANIRDRQKWVRWPRKE